MIFSRVLVKENLSVHYMLSSLADCLLLGKKQRIHVTLSNGPGYIHESSVIQILSSSGLQFSPVPPSSVMVYSTNKKEEPREGAMHIELNGSSNTEAYMYLPKCGPYEKAEIFFDAYAPVENADLFDCTTKHEVGLSSFFEQIWRVAGVW